MDLDKQINIIREKALKMHSLDVTDGYLFKYADIYSDILEEADRIKAMPGVHHVEERFFFPHNTVVDINELLQYEDSDFVEKAYVGILGRKPDKEGLESHLKNLQDGTISKIEMLKGIACSDEAKAKGTLLTGFKTLDVAEFMQYHEQNFVDMAYVLILGRHADPEGLENYLGLLMTGEISKEEVLYILKNSEEAAGRELEIAGLDSLYKKRLKKKRIFRIPVIGKCTRWALGMRHVNRKIKVLTLKEHATERKLQEILHQSNGDSGQLEQIRYQVAETAERLDRAVVETAERLDRTVIETTERLERSDRMVAETTERLAENAETVEQLDKQIVEAKEQLEGLDRETSDTRKHLEELHSFTNQIGSNVNEINGTLENIGSNVHDINEALGNYDKILGEYVSEDKKIIQTLLAEVYTLKARLSALEKNGVAVTAEAKSDTPVSEGVQDSYTSIDYFDFENHFRGSREHVKKVQAMYLPYFEGKKNVLDLGCGRGEFTEMLMEQNVGVTGVDQYAPYVEYMKTLGLPVVHDDAVHYLREQENVDGIFVGQVVEHISTEQIMELCKLAYEKLEEGSYFIMETPNPTSLAIYTECFYMDPSHQKPVHPQTLKYIAEKAGFSAVEILYTQASRLPFEIPKLKENDEDFREFNEAMGRVSDLLYGSQDYAIIARR